MRWIFNVLSVLFIPWLFATQGIEYYTVDIPNKSISFNFSRNQLVHVIDVDPAYCDILPAKATNSALGRSTPLDISKKTYASAAINGGCFGTGNPYDGLAKGTLKIHEWFALPVKPRGCIGWSKGKTPIFDRLLTSLTCKYKNKSYALEGLNRERKVNEAIVFTPIFAASSLTDTNGQELLIRNSIVEAIYSKIGNSPIPIDGYVLSIHKDHDLYDKFSVGMKLSFDLKVVSQTDNSGSEDWDNLDYIVGGTPLLIWQGTKVLDFSNEKTIKTFLTRRHSRTAIGLLPNKHIIFAVVDSGLNNTGMTILEMQNFMYDIGCDFALNLDGGGSSCMVLNNKVINKCRGDIDESYGLKIVRKVSDAIVAIPKLKSH